MDREPSRVEPESDLTSDVTLDTDHGALERRLGIDGVRFRLRDQAWRDDDEPRLAA